MASSYEVRFSSITYLLRVEKKDKSEKRGQSR